MGSVQSTWRIGPGGRSGCAGCLEDLSASQFLPTPPLALPPPLPSASTSLRGWVGRTRGGVGGDHTLPATCCLRVHLHRSGVAPWAPGWLGRPVGKVAQVTRLRLRWAHPPECYSDTPPPQQHSLNPGEEGPRPVATLAPPPGAHARWGCPVRVRSPWGRTGFGGGGGLAAPPTA